ncbi:ribosome maturation factor RimM [Leptolyngbya sp. BC1307]|uniref:ribosome maturation factor RimM n=1 Tax=Leptolyngbya sp. BC1307 TaxID=2029589 RepID=UPI000EFAB0C6|nr:ribosome maturation factor RimM [Leptolyngbya sp. BC1307]
MTAAQDWLIIGRIVGAHGLNGHVKVYAESDFPERFTEPGDRWIKKPADSQPGLIKLVSGRYLEGKNQYLVKLAGVDYRDQAEDLRQAELMVPESDRLSLAPGEFHVSDLIGLTVVVKTDQTTIGTVTDVFTTGHDMLEVTVAAPPENSEETAEADSALAAEKAIPHDSMRAKAAQKLKRQAKRKAKKKAPKTLLIPFVEEIVPVVDIATGRIEITPPPGLIDL